MAKLKGKARAKSRAKKFDPELIGGIKRVCNYYGHKKLSRNFKDFQASMNSAANL